LGPAGQGGAARQHMGQPRPSSSRAWRGHAQQPSLPSRPALIPHHVRLVRRLLLVGIQDAIHKQLLQPRVHVAGAQAAHDLVDRVGDHLPAGWKGGQGAGGKSAGAMSAAVGGHPRPRQGQLVARGGAGQLAVRPAGGRGSAALSLARTCRARSRPSSPPPRAPRSRRSPPGRPATRSSPRAPGSCGGPAPCAAPRSGGRTRAGSVGRQGVRARRAQCVCESVDGRRGRYVSARAACIPWGGRRAVAGLPAQVHAHANPGPTHINSGAGASACSTLDPALHPPARPTAAHLLPDVVWLHSFCAHTLLDDLEHNLLHLLVGRLELPARIAAWVAWAMGAAWGGREARGLTHRSLVRALMPAAAGHLFLCFLPGTHARSAPRPARAAPTTAPLPT
jgi:hypothetical protein